MAGTVKDCLVPPCMMQPHRILETVTVFQCETCGAILGDSTSFISHSEALRSITLKETHPESVQIHDKLEKPDRDEIMDSTFQKVSCAKCSQQVGMVFKNLPPHLAHMNGYISMLVDFIKTSHEIPVKKCDETQCLMETMRKMQEEISKIQFVILNLNERLKTVEQCLSSDNVSSDGYA